MARCSKFSLATMAAGFQRTFPVCEAFRRPARQLQGAERDARAVLFSRGGIPAECAAVFGRHGSAETGKPVTRPSPHIYHLPPQAAGLRSIRTYRKSHPIT